MSTADRVGVTGVVSLLARRLAAAGLPVSVVALSDGPLLSELARAGIPGRCLPVSRTFEPAAILRYRRHLLRNRYDVVHSHGARAMFAGNIAARLAGTPAIVTSFHEISSVKAMDTARYRLYASAEGWLARLCTDRCVATSQAVRDDAVRVRGVPERSIERIYNGIDSERYHPIAERSRLEPMRKCLGLRPGDVVIGTLGRLAAIKGHRHLIAALPRIQARVPAARVVIAGLGPLRDELERLAGEGGVGEDVLFAGDVEDANSFYNCLDVLALPSLSESCPLVVLEAMACDVPVVASNVGGVPELIDAGESGLLVPPGDVAALAEGITRMLLDRGLRSSTVAAARRRLLDQHSPERFAEMHAALYRRLLDGKRPRFAPASGS